ncbi:MAG: MBOAT family protein [Prevotellaceae bacterium]|nr:MBOAT family protein [Prevotellaceae bacterium]
MIFNSFQFLWLFPLVFLVYYGLANLPALSNKTRHEVENACLILVSYGLYMQWKPAYALLLLGVTAVTYFAALIIERQGEKTHYKRKCLLFVFAILALLPLLVFKYYNFINETVGSVFASIGFATNLPGLNWAIPVGISFFSFMAVGYLFDVYYGRIRAEHNWWNYMLFVSFFPQILSGPISKAKDLLPQIKADRHFSYSQAVAGLKFLLWGMFLKVVMADRLGLYVDTVFNNWQYNSGVSCLVASLAYSFQIYGDFAGYSLMAVGVGRLMGFELVNNFNRPYFSVSVTDFWRRWHISLSTWLKDYVYIPLGGSRCSKARNYLNIIVTFLVSGIWHGANWTFIVWGLLHGVLQVIEKALGLQRCESQKWYVRLPRIIVTFVFINFLWTIFRMPTIVDGIGVISRMFTQRGSLLPTENKQVLFSLMSLGIVILAEVAQEFAPSKFALMGNRRMAVRWSTYVFLLLLIILTGVLDSGQFIYVSF